MASTTSSLVKNAWNKKHYKQVATQLPIELVEEWEAKLKLEGITKADFIRNAIKLYLKKAEE